jgi:periplasmic protein TonB
MKKLISALALLCCVYNSFAQTDTTKKQATTTVKSDTSKTANNADGAFRKVEVESEFPGGLNGWSEFLQQNLTYPRKAVRKEIQGTVVLQFIVCTDGTVCDIEAISGPEELREAAVAALKKTPNWIPAIQDGRNVKSYKKQPIVYRLERVK